MNRHEHNHEVTRLINLTIESAYRWAKEQGYDEHIAREYAAQSRPSRFDVENQVNGIRFP